MAKHQHINLLYSLENTKAYCDTRGAQEKSKLEGFDLEHF
jgi:hypothetical protein